MLKTIIKLTALILWIGAGLNFLSKQKVEIDSAELIKPNGEKQTISLPYAEQSKENGNYVFDIKFQVNSFPTKTFLIWVDDCLEEIKLNHQDLSYIGRRCLDPDGLIIDFSTAYKAGENHLRIRVNELGGKLKITIKPLENSNFLEFLKLIYLSVGALLFYSMTSNVKNNRRVLNLIFLAFVFRFLFIFVLHTPESYLFSDMAGHERRAKEIISGIADAKHVEKPPGYHYLVALSLFTFKNLEAIKVIHLIASLLTCLIVTKASRSLFGKSLANLILAMMAVHVPLIFTGGLLMEECLFALCIAWMFLLLTQRASYLHNGLAFGLAFCLKGTHVFFLPIAFLWQLVFKDKNLPHNWMRFIIGFGLVLSSQLIITRAIYDTAKFPSAGAVNFLEGKCEGGSQVDNTGSYRYSPLYSQIGKKSIRAWPFSFEESDKVWRAGLDCIRQNPFVLISSLSSIYYLFDGNLHWPFNQTKFYELNAWYGMIYSFFIFPGILLGILRLAKSPKRVLPFLPALSLLFCVWFFKSEIRFRVPFDTIFIPLSVLGWGCTLKALFPRNYQKFISIAGIAYVLIVGFKISMQFLDRLIQ